MYYVCCYNQEVVIFYVISIFDIFIHFIINIDCQGIIGIFQYGFNTIYLSNVVYFNLVIMDCNTHVVKAAGGYIWGRPLPLIPSFRSQVSCVAQAN